MCYGVYLGFFKINFSLLKRLYQHVRVIFSYFIQNFCLPCIHMSKYTNNRGPQLFHIYIFTMFKSSFLGVKNNNHKIKYYFKPSLSLFYFILFCLGKRMPQSSSTFFVDLMTCNCILQCELYNLIPITVPVYKCTKTNTFRIDFKVALLNMNKMV